MKSKKLLGLFLLLLPIGFAGCNNDDDTPPEIVKIDGLTIDNYPRVDGSTSTASLIH